MTPLRALLGLMLASLALAGGVSAQQPATAPPAQAASPPSVFRQVIPQPTGKNGYEELVLAGETLKSSKLFAKAKEGEPTLELKRAVLADKAVVRTLALVRQALQKPVTQPRESLDFTTLLPELTLFRDIGRLLAMQQYVFLADGRVQEALGNARLGLRVGQVVQMDTLIHGLIGIAISASCIRPLAQHLDQLSARDCAVLYQICLEWLDQPNPQIRVLEGEQRWLKAGLANVRDQVKAGGLEGAAKTLGLEKKAIEEHRALIPTTPEAIDSLFSEVEKRMESFYVQVQSELRKPTWERRIVNVDSPNDVPGYMVSLVAPAYSRVDERYTQDMARIRLLACHAAIRRYRWEHDKLPASLTLLDLGELARDPFTGEWLRYQVTGNRYTLVSAGAPAQNADDPKAVGGRVPVGLTADE